MWGAEVLRMRVEGVPRWHSERAHPPDKLLSCFSSGVRLLQYRPPHLIWLIIRVFQRMELLALQSLDSLWRSQLPRHPVHCPGLQAMMRLPRYKLHHPRRSPPRRNHHRCPGQKWAENRPVEARAHCHHVEKIVLRLDGALAQAAVAVDSLQRSQVSLLDELGL